MSVAPFSLKKIGALWERFFFQPTDLSMCGLIRIGYSVLLLINVMVWAPDLERWFGEQGAMPFAVSRAVVDPDTITLFAWLPKTNLVLWTCYSLLLAQIVALLVGWFARFQALCIFLWLTSFQHRNMLIWDGEDWVFRLLAFYLIFLPIGECYSLCRRSREPLTPVWPLRLVQIQITLIYISNVWEKLNGSEWLDGIAIYYVSRLDDAFGRFPVPGFLFQSLAAIQCMTWSVLIIECLIPIGLWIKETRRAALFLAVGFHIATDYTMNLFLFHPIMLVGLLAFVDPAVPQRVLNRWRPRHDGNPPPPGIETDPTPAPPSPESTCIDLETHAHGADDGDSNPAQTIPTRASSPKPNSLPPSPAAGENDFPSTPKHGGASRDSHRPGPTHEETPSDLPSQ